MINRGYVVMLDVTSRQLVISPGSALDIIVGLPGSATAPVAIDALYPNMGATPAPAGWNGGYGAYYEVRGRSIPIEKIAGQAGFVSRFRLGMRLSIVALQNVQGSGNCSNLLPMLSLSASLAPAPGAGNPAIFPADYATTFADPSYGPVIRIDNSLLLEPGSIGGPALYYVSLGIAEAKDEDFTPFGRG